MTSQDSTVKNMLVIVRDHDGCRFLEEVNDWDVTTLLAGVSADPRSFREFALSWSRYRESEPLEGLCWRDFAEFSAAPSQADRIHDDDWILIDLANLRVESNREEAIPAEPAAYQRDEGRWTPENPLVWLNLPPSWQRVISPGSGPCLPPPVAPREALDFRGVLFGRAMTEDFAARMHRIALRETLPGDHCTWDDLPWDADPDEDRRKVAERWHELTKQVHAEWLMTPRDDLGGETPRVFLHRGRDWAEREIHNRSQQWSSFRTPPRALDRDTHACIHGPMGRDEVVIYFDLCREVIHAGWKMLLDSPELREDPRRWASAMYDHGRNWLKNGRIDGSPTAPEKIIESSRRHMPLLADGSHLDCECPICRMMADDHESFYPTFTGFDGHHLELDEEFAFSLCKTREEWEKEQAMTYRETGASDGGTDDDDGPGRRERRADDLLAATSDYDAEKDADEERAGESVWQGYVNSEEIGLTVLGLGFRLAELIGDLQRRKCSRGSIAALNDAFDDVRKTAVALPERRHAAETMKIELEQVAEKFPDLVGKSADLQSQLDQWMRRLALDGEIPI